MSCVTAELTGLLMQKNFPHAIFCFYGCRSCTGNTVVIKNRFETVNNPQSLCQKFARIDIVPDELTSSPYPKCCVINLLFSSM